MSIALSANSLSVHSHAPNPFITRRLLQRIVDMEAQRSSGSILAAKNYRTVVKNNLELPPVEAKLKVCVLNLPNKFLVVRLPPAIIVLPASMPLPVRWRYTGVHLHRREMYLPVICASVRFTW